MLALFSFLIHYKTQHTGFILGGHATTTNQKIDVYDSWSFHLQAYGGRDGMLSLKEDKASGGQVITAVDRNCEVYSTYR